MATLAEVSQMIATNRLTKAQAFAAALQARNFTAADARALDPHGWHIVAAAAGRKPANGREALSAETKELVYFILECAEQYWNGDFPARSITQRLKRSTSCRLERT